MLDKNWTFKRGDVYMADLGPAVGSEQAGLRPVIVIQNDVGNLHSPNVTIVPLTTKDKKPNQPTHYRLWCVPCLKEQSTALGENVETISKERIIRYMGRVGRVQMQGIEEAVKNHLGFYIPECVDAP